MPPDTVWTSFSSDDAFDTPEGKASLLLCILKSPSASSVGAPSVVLSAVHGGSCDARLCEDASRGGICAALLSMRTLRLSAL
jgi:hypothetical protein